MFATALIVFRETLEAALFVGIVAAATRGLPGRAKWLVGGVFAGILGSLALATGANRISTLADGIGQDLVNASILGVALIMLAWHCIWVTAHGKEMSLQARQLATSVSEGTRSQRTLVVAVVLVVLREGAETVLFVTGLATGSPGNTQNMMLGALFGVLGGVGLGLMIYFGLSRVKPQNLFAVTNVLILLMAAAIASQLARALAQSGLVELWSGTLWDTSGVLPNDSPMGVLLRALVGYDAQPSGMQVAFYISTLVFIGLLTLLAHRRQQRKGFRKRLGSFAQAR